MEDFPWLTVIGLVPLAGAAIVASMPRERGASAKVIALGTALITLAVTIAMAVGFDPDGARYQYVENYDWIPAFGVNYAIGVDGIALMMILLTVALMPILILAAWKELDPIPTGRQAVSDGPGAMAAAEAPPSAAPAMAPADEQRPVGVYLALMLVLETMAIGQFAAIDVFFFYVLFEAMLVPTYFLIGRFGGPQRQYAAVKFLLYNLLGGLLMLVGVITLYWVGPGGQDAYLLSNLIGGDFGTGTARWIFLAFLVAFAIKAPLWPVHTWLPDAAAEATPSNAVLLSGVLDKVGVFAMLHLALPIFPEAAQWFAPLVVTLAVISIIYGGLLAIGQTDIKRMIAYASISHFGFIVLGIFVMTSQGQSGATLYMVNHAFATAGLFLLAGFMISRRGSRLITDYGGLQKVAPVMAGSLLFAGLANLSLPGLSTFVSEFLVLLGAFSRYEVAGILATAGVILAALYVTILYQRTMAGELEPANHHTVDLGLRERWIVAPIVVVVLALGIFPKPALEVINPAVAATLADVGARDPAPQADPVPGTTAAEESP